jgi:hypothetical protein
MTGASEEGCRQIFDELAEFHHCPELKVESRSQVAVRHILKYNNIDEDEEAKAGEKSDLK